MSTINSRALVPVTVMVFTLNEERNLPDCLGSLHWTDDVIVIDSYSTDSTVKIATAWGCRVFQNEFKGFGSQRNWALENTSPKYEWILVLDADEKVTTSLSREIGERIRDVDEKVAAFRLKRRFYMWGRWLRHSALYPTWVVRLIRKGRVSYVDRGHAETQLVDGSVATLRNDIVDENNKGLEEWFERQNRYSTKDAEYELEQEGRSVNVLAIFKGDPLERRSITKRIIQNLPFRPTLYFLYSYILRGGFLEGRDGYYFCQMRSFYQRMVVIKKRTIRKGRGI